MAKTSTGVRCTIVGTPGTDVLVGTKHRDVICGGAGLDLIKARGGDDLIDPGAGGDWVYGGHGKDHVLASTGANVIHGGRGDDHLSGGVGHDVLYGGAGNDWLSGSDGWDILFGGDGIDTLYGGDGTDTLDGGASADRLFGQSGDDQLTGGTGADVLDGGTGENECSSDPEDTSVHCYYAEDKAPPVIVETTMTPTSVDVSDASALVTVMVHATDDTGVRYAQVQLYSADNRVQLSGSASEMVSGTVHDGWWRSTFDIGWGNPAGDLKPRLFVTDNFGHQATQPDSTLHLHVTDTNPDSQSPQVTLLEPSAAGPIDVRTQPADVTVSVAITDNLSGVKRVDLGLSRPDGLYYSTVLDQESVPISSGTTVDGVWTAVLQIPKGAAGGDWNVEAYVEERSGVSPAEWMGPDAYQRFIDSHSVGLAAYPFPNDAGRLTVVGT